MLFVSNGGALTREYLARKMEIFIIEFVFRVWTSSCSKLQVTGRGVLREIILIRG
jgi:hypothetical protein